MTKTQKIMQAVVLIITIAFAVCFVFIVSPFMDFMQQTLDNRPIGLLLSILIAFSGLLISIFLQTIIHESGHLVCGLISGYKFSSFRILSACFIKENNKLKLKKISIPGTAGQCLMLPPTASENKKTPYFLYNIGGCLFNAIFSITCAVFLYLYGNNPIILCLLGTFTLTGGFLILNNGLPVKTNLIQNDGQNIIDIGKSQQALNSFVIQLLVAEAQTRGIKLCDMPNEWFIMPSDEHLNNPLVSTHASLICSRLIDSGDFYQAHKLMQHLLVTAPDMLGLYKLLMELELIYLDAVNGWANYDEIYNRLKQREKLALTLKTNPGVQRIFYTVELICKANEVQAQKHLALFEKCAKKYPYKQEIETERKLIKLAFDRATQLKSQLN